MNQRIKVLQLCAVGFTVEKLLLPLVDEMRKYYDVTVVCSYDETSDRLRDKGYDVRNIPIDRKISPIRNLKSVIQLYRLMRKERFDVVHVHTPVAGILGRIAAKLARVPVVIYTAHGFYFHDHMPPWKKNLFILFERVGGWLSDYIFTQSTEDYETAIAKRIISREKILTIGNGVDIERFSIGKVGKDRGLQIRREFGIKECDVVVGIIGRVVSEKGYLEWVKAARLVLKQCPDTKFIAVGDTLESDRDGIKKELDGYIRDHGMEGKVIFAGSRSDIPELLSVMDIFTLPSYREGMPRSIIEAMSMSRPVVATDIRGCREEVIDGVTGFLVPVRDAESLADRIIYLIQHPQVRESMGKEARQRADRDFNEQKVLQRQMEVVQTLLKERKR